MEVGKIQGLDGLAGKVFQVQHNGRPDEDIQGQPVHRLPLRQEVSGSIDVGARVAAMCSRETLNGRRPISDTRSILTGGSPGQTGIISEMGTVTS